MGVPIATASEPWLNVGAGKFFRVFWCREKQSVELTPERVVLLIRHRRMLAGLNARGKQHGRVDMLKVSTCP